MKHHLIKSAALLLAVLLLCGCGAAEAPQNTANAVNEEAEPETAPAEVRLSELQSEGMLELSYATQFRVEYLEGGYKRIFIEPDQNFLVVPENAPVPTDLDADITVLQQPLDHIFVVGTSAMDHFRQLDSIDKVTLSSLKAGNWYIPEARTAMEQGSMVYAGKYSAPDYELILAKGCDLAVESTMIYHTPEVQEQLEGLGIPVLVEHSGYEEGPLGRMEWIKLYAALLNKDEEAAEWYRTMLAETQLVAEQAATGKTVAYFYVTGNGTVNVRKSGDYIAKAIELAGGTYIAFDSDEENALSTMTIQMETFYAEAIHADVLLYNATIDAELTTISQLLEKSPLLADFDAVKNGNVWCVGKDFYQQPLSLGNLILDIHSILEGNAEDGTFIHRLTK